MATVPASSSTICSSEDEARDRAQHRRTQRQGPVASESLGLVIPGASYSVTMAADNSFSTPRPFHQDFRHLKPRI